MSLARTKPMTFSPVGCSDALDATNVFSGAMSLLQNLIPDPTTKNLWQCRPAARKLIDFTTRGGFTAPVGFISASIIIGDRFFGMMQTGRNPGQEEPFCYDILHDQVVTINGVTQDNTPLNAPTSGTWVPPIMAMIGTKIILTHPGYNGLGGNFFGTLDLSDPTNLQWSSGNTSPTLLAFPPTAVAQFGNRAYFIVNPPRGQPAVYFSDVLLPNTITNATQILTFGDNQRLTAFGGLPLSNQLGGIIQALMVFKGNSNIFQITGDFALNTLAVNTLNVATGTLAPLSVSQTPKGLVFQAPEGLRVIDFAARISDPIGEAGQGITVPFIYSAIPTRVNVTANADVIRATTYNGFAPGAPAQEWWYDMTRSCWHGPHTFPADQINPYQDSFIMTPIGVPASVWRSDSVQNNSSGFVENGVQLNYRWRTTLLPDTNEMSENAMIETTIHMSVAAGLPPPSVSAQNEMGFNLDEVPVTPLGAGTFWNQFNWNTAPWNGPGQPLFPRTLNWHYPIVFRRLAIDVNGQSAPGIQIGDLRLRYETLGYLQIDQMLGNPLGNWAASSGGLRTADTTIATADTTVLTADASP